MLEYYLAGAGLKLAQIVIYSSLWIVIGCFVAAYFRRILGPAKTRKFFGAGSKRGLFTGWLMGMLIPVCSLGVIPIVRELHRSKVPGGTIIAFGLTAPLFNPLSVLYGLTLSDPIAIITFSFCSLLIVTGLGFLWDLFSKTEEIEASETESHPAYGIKRMIALFDSTCRELVGPSLGYIVVGIIGSVIIAMSLPFGYLQAGLEQTNLFAPTKVAAIATPVYTTPLLAMSQIGGMFQHGNSIGAAFSLLILGAGVNLGLLCCLGGLFGYKRMLLFFVILFGVTLGLAYTISGPLYPEGIEAAGHSHAFDVYSSPFQSGQKNVYAIATSKAQDFWKTNEYGGTYILGFLILAGVAFQLLSTKIDLEPWYQASSAAADKYDTVLPPWVLALTMIVFLVGTSVASCYIYYPPPGELLEDMNIINTDCILDSRNQKWDAAEKWIALCDDLSRRLEIGVFLREGSVDEFHSTTAQIYREKLDDLKHSVEDRDPTRLPEQTLAVQKSYTRMKKAFREKYGDKK